MIAFAIDFPEIAMLPTELKQWRLSLKPERGRTCTQTEAARRLNTPWRTYQDWETGRRRIPGSLGFACAAVLRGLPAYPGDGEISGPADSKPTNK